MSTAPSAAPALPDEERQHRALEEEVLDGLKREQKMLPCKLFYDAHGSQLFDRICELEEYYLTRTEMAIMRAHVSEMVARLGPRCLLVEYGSGSSRKTRILLDHLEAPAAYVPVDISRKHLMETAADLAAAYPDLPIRPVCADYTGDFELPLAEASAARVVVYFPGSTIGNFDPPAARAFLERIAEVCGRGGGLLIGVDLQKDPAVLERAYDDAEGVTAAFNLNILRHLNRRLRSNFRLDRFAHQARYNREEGRIEMHLISLADQEVRLGREVIRFRKGETVHTENSYKYTREAFADLARQSGFAVEAVWTDERDLFSVQYLRVL